MLLLQRARSHPDPFLGLEVPQRVGEDGSGRLHPSSAKGVFRIFHPGPENSAAAAAAAIRRQLVVTGISSEDGNQYSQLCSCATRETPTQFLGGKIGDDRGTTQTGRKNQEMSRRQDSTVRGDAEIPERSPRPIEKQKRRRPTKSGEQYIMICVYNVVGQALGAVHANHLKQHFMAAWSRKWLFGAAVSCQHSSHARTLHPMMLTGFRAQDKLHGTADHEALLMLVGSTRNIEYRQKIYDKGDTNINTWHHRWSLINSSIALFQTRNRFQGPNFTVITTHSPLPVFLLHPDVNRGSHDGSAGERRVRLLGFLGLLYPLLPIDHHLLVSSSSKCNNIAGGCSAVGVAVDGDGLLIGYCSVVVVVAVDLSR